MTRETYRKRTIPLTELVRSLPRYVRARFAPTGGAGDIDPAIEEKISLEVSAINECKFCYQSHLIVSEFVSGNEESHAGQPDSEARQGAEWHALNYARINLNQINDMPTSEDVDAAFAEASSCFNARQLERVRDVVFVMNFNNRCMNKAELFVLRVLGRARPSEPTSLIGGAVTLLLVPIIAVPRLIQLAVMKAVSTFRRRRASAAG